MLHLALGEAGPPGREKSRARSACLDPNRWMMKLGASSGWCADCVPITEKDTADGATDTEATLDAVSPTGPSGPAALMTATPVG